MRVDAHMHVWRIADRAGHWPPPDLTVLHRDFTPADLVTRLDEAGIDGAVLVQSLPDEAETASLLAVAAEHPVVRGVVGWTDLKAPAAPAAIARLARNPRLKGLRPMLQDLVDEAWIDDPALAPAVDAMVAHDLAFDALVRPGHLPHLRAFAARHPALRIVVDHGGKPRIGGGSLTAWRTSMADLAALPNVVCKLSGLLTEVVGDGHAEVESCAATLLALFGPERLIWGSDWPVLTLAADYGTWLGQCRAMVPADHHGAVFGGNAVRFYRLDDEP
ncbi:amidohydrolase family protein [Methylobacterium sp. JK268]